MTANVSAGVMEMSWTDANQAVLVAEFGRLRRQLGGKADAPVTSPREARALLEGAPAAIDQLGDMFGLSGFERDLLLLCAGTEMDLALSVECARAQGQAGQGRAGQGQGGPGVGSFGLATFGLAMATLDDPHWSALTPARPLRRFRLVQLDASRGLSSAPLRIDERVLHYIAGTNLLDPQLDGLAHAPDGPMTLAVAHRAVAERATVLLNCNAAPVLHLCGNDTKGQQDVAWATASELDRTLLVLRVEDLPAPGAELDQILLLLERELLLLPAMVMLQCSVHGLTPAARRLAERVGGPVAIASPETVRLDRAVVRFDVDKPEPAEQQRLWHAALGPGAEEHGAAIRKIAEQFRLSTSAIFAAGMQAQSEGEELQPEKLWDACRAASRPQLEHMAQRIVPTAVWEDLVLPETQTRTLRQMASQVRHRMKVYEDWGFSARGRRGLGVSALLAGESGTGKTLAAEVLAAELRLDLYRIDLSSVVSKYIGDTEKNLRQVFDAAEDGGVMLLFDEADALFGKRAEVKDSHDRYSNIEVSYLLQRMEAYEGLAVLTTNLKSSLDRAFQRRLRFIVNFPFPDALQREAIWRRILPAMTPTERLDYARLAQLNVAGGNIRNIAMTGAFLAAEAGCAVGMAQLLEAAHVEAQKMERPLSPAEIRGWA